MQDLRFSQQSRFKSRSSGFVTLYSNVVGCQHFGGPCCHHLEGEATGDGIKGVMDIGLEWNRATETAVQWEGEGASTHIKVLAGSPFIADREWAWTVVNEVVRKSIIWASTVRNAGWSKHSLPIRKMLSLVPYAGPSSSECKARLFQTWSSVDGVSGGKWSKSLLLILTIPESALFMVHSQCSLETNL
jgi:hypothetical protein